MAGMVWWFQLTDVIGSHPALIESYSTSSIEVVGRVSCAIPANLGDGEGDGGMESTNMVNTHLLMSFTVTGTFDVSLPDHFLLCMSLQAVLDSSIVFPAMPPPGLIQNLVV